MLTVSITSASTCMFTTAPGHGNTASPLPASHRSHSTLHGLHAVVSHYETLSGAEDFDPPAGWLFARALVLVLAFLCLAACVLLRLILGPTEAKQTGRSDLTNI